MNFCKQGLSVIEIEAQAIFNLTQRIGQNFEEACELLFACKGRVVVTGMGKSGHIGNKIAATLASTGTPAFFMHPAEASHGDLGMITPQDVVLAISYSGASYEILTLLPLFKRMDVPLISLTGDKHSLIAKAANVNLDIGVDKEACPLGLAPTTSTTATLVMGDAIAIALLEARGFSREDFALSHPGGMLGKRLLLHAEELCHQGKELPVVKESVMISEALIEVTEKKLGMTCIINSEGTLVGVYTDGDIRRTLNEEINIKTTPLWQVMTTHCKTIKKGLLATDALALMQDHSITSLVLVDDENKPVGLLHMHDLLRAGLFKVINNESSD